MFSIFKKNKEEGVPAWASFFTPKEYEKFIDALGNWLNDRSITFEISDGVVHLRENNPTGFDKMGLTNVAQNCKQNKISQYKEIVSDHFESLIRNYEQSKKFEELASDFEQIKQYIGVRIYSNDYVAHLGKEKTIGFDLCEDLYAMLVLDLPDAITNVQPDDFELWNKTKEELFKLGMVNVKANYDFPIMKEAIDDVDFYAVVADHFFSANIYFDLENHPELMGLYGSIISFPHRHTTLIYPIDNMDVLKVIHHLINMTYGMNVEGPGSISHKIYWLHSNRFSEIEYAFEDNQLSITPSEEFVDLLNRLGETNDEQILN